MAKAGCVMAAIHVCDVCGARMQSRSDLWEITFHKIREQPIKRTAVIDKQERFEACDKCKKKAYVALMEGGKRE